MNFQRWLVPLLALAFWAGNAKAVPESASENSEKPFASKHVVLQISDRDPSKQTLVLNVANNLIQHYGPDLVEIEIVAFGPGLRLLMADNANGKRIDGLAAQGVRFAACDNTLRNFTKQLGEKPQLHSSAKPVPAGVVRIMDLITEGYTLIKP